MMARSSGSGSRPTAGGSSSWSQDARHPVWESAPAARARLACPTHGQIRDARVLARRPVDRDGRRGPHRSPLGRGHRPADRLAAAASARREPAGLLARRPPARDRRRRWHRPDLGGRPGRVGAVAARPDGPPAAARAGLATSRAGHSRSPAPASARTVPRPPPRATQGLARLVETRSGQPVGPPMTQRWPQVRTADLQPRRPAPRDRQPRRPYRRGREHQTHLPDLGRGDRPAGVAAAAAHQLGRGDWPSAPTARSWPPATTAAPSTSGTPRTGARRRPAVRRGLDRAVSLAFSPDGRLLAAGTAEPAFRVVAWDLDTGRPLRRADPLPGQRHAPRLQRRRRAAWPRARDDATVRLIEVGTGRLARRAAPVRRPCVRDGLQPRTADSS